MTRLRVLHAIASSRGGGAAQMRELAAGLPRDRFEVFATMPEDGGTVAPPDFADAGVHFLASPAARRVSPVLVARYRRQLRRHRIDILHVHGARAAAAGRLAAASMPNRPRVVYTLHGFAAPFYPWTKRVPYLWLERCLQNTTDAMVCVAQAELDAVSAFHLADTRKLRVVRCGIDVERFAVVAGDARASRTALGLGRGPTLLTACRLDAPRDFGVLLAAFHRVRRELPDAQLVIAGDGPRRRQITDECHRRGLAEAVRFLGYQRAMAPLLSLADVFVLTSDGWEGLPVSVLEAQAAGVAVVATDAGGAREAVADGETGMLTPPRDVPMLAGALLTLLRRPDLRRQFGRAGQARVRRAFSRARMVAEMVDVYERLECRADYRAPA